MELFTIGEENELEWQEEAANLAIQDNLLCFTKPEFQHLRYYTWLPLMWFGTVMASYLVRNKDTEVHVFYGKHMNNLADFCYQLCRSVPWSFEMGVHEYAIWDVLMHFQTQPKNRVFIWHDAQYLFSKDREAFETIFYALVVSDHLHSIGDGVYLNDEKGMYHVNHKNIFLFDEMEGHELDEWINKEYQKHSFTKLLIK